MSDLKILVVSSIPPRRHTDEPGASWADLSELTWATQKRYCEKWGYTFHGDVSDLHETYKSPIRGVPPIPNVPIYYKIKFILFKHFLNPDSCKEEWDWVVWLDSDLLVTNYEIPLEKFMNGSKGADTDEGGHQLGDILLTYDVNGLHATVIMLRRTPYTLGYAYMNAEAGMRYYMRDYWSDQLSQRLALQTPPYRDLVWYHPVKALCAMPPDTYRDIPKRARAMYEWDESSLALHLSALSMRDRIRIAKEYVDRLDLLPGVSA